MKKFCKLITVDSYFGVFEKIGEIFSSKPSAIDKRNLIFSEDKVSLMLERVLCATCVGSFNTEVLSFGRFLRARATKKDALSKEGGAMVVKKILTDVKLKRFSASRQNLAPALYELIVQLKSSSVSPSDLLLAIEQVDGLLKYKLEDVYAVYVEYEKFLAHSNYTDQSALLDELPEIIAKENSLEDTDVYLVGYRAWTRQAQTAIKALIGKAKSVTAVLTAGENAGTYLNETAQVFEKLCRECNANLQKESVQSKWSFSGKIIAETLFNPIKIPRNKIKTDQIFVTAYNGKTQEVNSVLETIKKAVIEGKCRYNDITIAVPQEGVYDYALKDGLARLEIPYFLDERKAPENHPLIKLIVSYIEIFRKGYERDDFLAFIKNPLVIADKDMTDDVENYLLRYGIKRVKLDVLSDRLPEIEREKIEKVIKTVKPCFEKFDILGTLERLGVKEKLEDEKLNGVLDSETLSINAQIYDKVVALLNEMDGLLSGVELTYAEIKAVFGSGVRALKLSIIPQYHDAVFIGKYKEVGLAKAKYLFCIGLDSTVPNASQDVALLTDGDITALSETQLKLFIEPKITLIAFH